jgi:hypothetical protein
VPFAWPATIAGIGVSSKLIRYDRNMSARAIGLKNSSSRATSEPVVLSLIA